MSFISVKNQILKYEELERYVVAANTQETTFWSEIYIMQIKKEEQEK